MSRHQAIKAAKGRAIARELEDQGILVKGASKATLVEEIPDAYKDVNDVVNVVHGAGIAKKVVKLKPIGVIKG
jgi:tRNA-splicing ligase RtcB